MKQQKQTQTVLIRDPRAVAIINARAQKENRSCSNCAAVIVFESANKKHPGQPKFLDDVILKGGDAEKSNEKVWAETTSGKNSSAT
jgi:hypothetical protein